VNIVRDLGDLVAVASNHVAFSSWLHFGMVFACNLGDLAVLC
jgi:hypothetical protein